ncbi:hypothetical protein SERLA73DRAFT_52644 [Serpula lacrymans var. lacrymans S7.3]|uniref:Uncharacterized protein n=2 Tax=Serpula lacrymans var. lacrymans TaxID=341189 RepID=F8PU97_SERL3|nr:uncharacterized protein SERLADRAFT_348417 [Serpula lacrymans var. lacrymans S7.9]EGO00410.1 hypothetical protein SERLA73DRAFT_52644 [Serpula lacrymans var. lacrymans S7.3]EGO25966.1 hypothetical protein SERLADRAFT_348417 [Serpula lacrymans var. lacrymans S7.9]
MTGASLHLETSHGLLHIFVAFWRKVAYHLKTAFLFTKSDVMTTLIPITIFAAVAAPLCSVWRIVHVMCWIWVHLLQFDVSNQTVFPEEDRRNKATRPLPAGRILMRNAVYLRWFLVPVCFMISSAYGIYAFYASILLVALTVCHNELQGHRHWMSKSLLTAAGLVSFELGGTLVAGCCHSEVDNVGVLAIILSAMILATTIHSQDFKDEEGDRLIGRQTLAIASPVVGRSIILVLLPIWSISLCKIWHVDFACSLAFLALSLIVGTRFMLATTVQADKMAYLLYNVS